MELCLIGLFFIVKDASPKGEAAGTPCKVQGIIMIVVLILTLLYQWLLNGAFGPLLRYLPITLEDEAVVRDEEFARIQEKRWKLEDDEQEVPDVNERSRDRECLSAEKNRSAENIELQTIEASEERGRMDPKKQGFLVPEAAGNLNSQKRSSWAGRSQRKMLYSSGQMGQISSPRQHYRQHHPARRSPDVEAQRSGTNAIGEALFAGINDDIEDLTSDERDKLVQRAFQHEALRARRPVIWIPRDDLGVSDDEIYRTQKLSKYIWISNEFTGLDSNGRVVYRKSPPDFSEVDLIEL